MYQTMGNYGWICPKCGTVHAPWVATCYCQTPYEYVPWSDGHTWIYTDPEPQVTYTCGGGRQTSEPMGCGPIVSQCKSDPSPQYQ